MKEAREDGTRGEITKRELSPRELQILQMIAQGDNANEIAVKLDLSPHTIRNYQTTIRERVEARNMAHAVALAKDRGLI